MELVPPVLVLIAGGAPVILLVLLLILGVSTSTNRASMMLGLRLFVRNLKEGASRMIPVALLASIVVSSLSVGDGLLLMVERNTDANLSGVDVVVSFPSPVDKWVIQGSIPGPAGPVADWDMMLSYDGIAESEPAGRRNDVRVMGVFNGGETILGIRRAVSGELEELEERTDAYVNLEMARSLDLEKGDTFTLSIYDRGAAQDNLLGYSSDSLPVVQLTVADIIANKGIGRFRQDALSKVDPICVMHHHYLRDRLGLIDGVNTMLIDMEDDRVEEGIDLITESLDEWLTMEDAGFRLELKDDRMILTHRDFFFHPEDVGLDPGSGTLSYFVDRLDKGTVEDNPDPLGLSYSVVVGLQDNHTFRGDGYPSQPHWISPYNLTRGEVIVNNWTAERMELASGIPLTLTYRRVSELGTLMEEKRSFKVAKIVPMEHWMAWDGWMPDLPGITEAPSCGDWDPSFEIDVDSLTDGDFEYWDVYRTAPKCMIHVEDAREMWGVTTGNTTLVVLKEGNLTYDDLIAQEAILSEHITVESMGGSVRNVRKEALDSSRAMLIFPGMFLTFGSIIMIGSLLVLYALFRDLAGKRAHTWGILRAVGVTRKDLLVTGTFEALVPILVGGGLGIPLGYIIGYALNLGLGSAWSDSVEGAGVPFSVSTSTITISLGLSVLFGLILAVASIIREAMAAPIANIRDEDPTVSSFGRRGRVGIIIAGLLIIEFGLWALAAGSTITGMTSAGFFVTGSILVSSGSGLLLYLLIARVRYRSDLSLMVSSNLSRRPGKNPLSIAILSLMLTLALSLTFMGSLLEEDVSSSYDEYGGGFAWVVETAIPHRGEVELPGMEVSVLLSIGEEGGTCSNINAPYPPRLLGVEDDFHLVSDFGLLSRLDRFGSDGDVWTGLDSEIDGRIPILVDQNTLLWIYYEDLGSEFKLDSEDGTELTLVVVGILEPSVLTGTFVLSKSIMKQWFPSMARPTYFLISGDGVEEEREKISEAFSDSLPKIEWVGELARENLDYELSYLYLFRDFLMFGLLVAMASAAIFAHARALSLRKEMISLRSIGVTRIRSVQYFLAENMVVFSVATVASVAGSVISILIFGGLGGGAPSPGTSIPSAIVIGAFLLVSLIVSLISSMTAIRSFSGLTHRN
ncbi:MAG: FtsX-like permease family protein [Thermoplasmatota archaeon]